MNQSPEPRLHHQPALVHGRYLVRPPVSGDAVRGLLVGFHGYGETAADHMEELGRIPGAESWLVVAVEALHSFYKRSGDVVSCWMTKRDRELAIEENLRYVASVVSRVEREELGEGPATERVPLVFAGFSQGVAMAYRAAARGGHPARGVLALAGDVPPEIRDLPGHLEVVVGRGREDGWYDETKMEADLARLASFNVEAEPVVFDGGHVWTDAYRERAGALLDRLSRPVRPDGSAVRADHQS